MRYRQIGLGSRIELELYDGNGDKVKPVLVSQYETYDEKTNLMEVHVPFYEGKIFPVHTGAIMNVIFSKGNDTYSFQAQAVGREYQSSIAILKIKPVSPIERIERRSFFRMNCTLEAEYRIIEAFPIDDTDQEPFIKTVTRDISGGGVCLITPSKLKNGTMLELYLKLERNIRFIGIVTRSMEVREKGKITHETGIEFKRIENKDRERIISYVFETQRDKLRKNWLRREEENLNG